MADQNCNHINDALFNASSDLADVAALVSAARRLAEPVDDDITNLLGMAMPQILAIQDQLEAINAPSRPGAMVTLAPPDSGSIH